MRNKIVAFSMMIFLIACGDRTVDQYHQDKVNQETARDESAAGTYRGTLTMENGITHQTEIDLDTTITPVDSSDNTTTAGQVVMEGKIILMDAPESNATIQKAQYFPNDNSNTGTFSGSIGILTRTVNSSATTTASLTIMGSINGPVFTGKITPVDDGITANFNLVKGAPFPSSQGSTAPNGGPPAFLNYTSTNQNKAFCSKDNYSADLCNGGKGFTENLTLSLGIDAPTSEEAFLNNFLNEKIITVQLNLDGNGDGFTFPAVEFNQKTGVFSGQTNVTGDSGSQTSTAQIDCDPRGQGYHCIFNNTYRNYKDEFIANAPAPTPAARHLLKKVIPIPRPRKTPTNKNTGAP